MRAFFSEGLPALTCGTFLSKRNSVSTISSSLMSKSCSGHRFSNSPLNTPDSSSAAGTAHPSPYPSESNVSRESLTASGNGGGEAPNVTRHKTKYHLSMALQFASVLLFAVHPGGHADRNPGCTSRPKRKKKCGALGFCANRGNDFQFQLFLLGFGMFPPC